MLYFNVSKDSVNVLPPTSSIIKPSHVISRVRNFKKNFLRVSTPPDKDEANKNIASYNADKHKELPKLSRNQFLMEKRRSKYSNMHESAKLKRKKTLKNLITETGLLAIEEIK